MAGCQKFVRWLVCVSLVVIFGICHWALAAYAQAKVKIAFPGVTLLILPLVIAEEAGFFRNEGLDVTAVQMRPNLSIQAVMSGDIDYAMAAGSGVMAASKGLKVMVVAVNVNRPPHVLISLPRFKSTRDLKGQTIGSGTFGSTYYVTREVLQSAGLDPDRDVKWLPVGQTPERLQLLSKGLISATPLAPPDSLVAKRMGFKELTKASPLVEYPFNGYVVTVKKMREKPDEVERLLRANLRSLQWIHQDKTREEVVRVIMKRLKLDRETAEASLEAMKESFSKDGEISEAGVRFVFKMAQDAGQIGKEPRMTDVIDFEPLRRVREEMGLLK